MLESISVVVVVELFISFGIKIQNIKILYSSMYSKNQYQVHGIQQGAGCWARLKEIKDPLAFLRSKINKNTYTKFILINIGEQLLVQS